MLSMRPLLSLVGIAALAVANPQQGFSSSSSATSTTSVNFQSVVEGWSALPNAFASCLTTFQQSSSTSIQVATQSVQTLWQSASGVMKQYGSISSSGVQATSAQVTQFQQIITQCFTSWQSILAFGQSQFQGQWQQTFTPLFQPFGQFVTITKQVSASFGLDLSAVLSSLHLNLNLFVGVGLNLGGLLGGVLNTVGGLLGHGLLGKREPAGLGMGMPDFSNLMGGQGLPFMDKFMGKGKDEPEKTTEETPSEADDN